MEGEYKNGKEFCDKYYERFKNYNLSARERGSMPSINLNYDDMTILYDWGGSISVCHPIGIIEFI